ncbi:hypothetical protein Tco_0006527 [Tanacetum coccineum]
MLAIQAEEGEGSGYPSESQAPPSTGQPTNEEPIPNVVSSSHQKTQTPSAAKVHADASKENVHTYTRRRRAVSTGSDGISTAKESVSTAGASMPVSTAGMVQEVNISIPSPVVIKDKAAVRLQEELDEEERQRMARVHKAAQSFTEEEWENIRARVEADEELSRRLQAEERNKYNEVDQAKMLVDLINQRKKYFAAQKVVAKRKKPSERSRNRGMFGLIIKTGKCSTLLKPIGDCKIEERALEFAARSSQANNYLIQQKDSFKTKPEEEEEKECQRDLQPNDVMWFFPVEEVYVQALQDMLKIFDKDDLVILWNLVKERFNSSEPTDDKERAL